MRKKKRKREKQRQTRARVSTNRISMKICPAFFLIAYARMYVCMVHLFYVCTTTVMSANPLLKTHTTQNPSCEPSKLLLQQHVRQKATLHIVNKRAKRTVRPPPPPARARSTRSGHSCSNHRKSTTTNKTERCKQASSSADLV